jgi:hypothetical protein
MASQRRTTSRGGRGRGGASRTAGGGNRFLRQQSSGATDYLADPEEEPLNVSRAPVNVSTDLYIHFLDESMKQLRFAKGPKTFWELQEILAKNFPGSKKYFSVLSEHKEFITSENFTPSKKFIIRECFSLVASSRYPLVPVKWDYRTYHAKPESYVDYEEERLKARQERELKLLKDKQEEERLAAEFLGGGNKPMEADDFN